MIVEYLMRTALWQCSYLEKIADKKKESHKGIVEEVTMFLIKHFLFHFENYSVCPLMDVSW